MDKKDFKQRLDCAVPKHWSKYITGRQTSFLLAYVTSSQLELSMVQLSKEGLV